MSSQDLDIGEQAISKAVKTGLESQFDAVESLDVEIRTDPIKLAQGQVDKAVIEGKGLVIQNDLRTESLKLEADSVDISMMQVALGKIALDQSADATAQVVLKANDLQEAFASDYVKRKLRGQKIELPSGERVTTDVSNVQFTIPEDGKIALEADVMLIEKVETHHIAFSAKPQLTDGGQVITLVDLDYDEATNDMPELTQSLVDSTEDLLDLRNFEVGDMSLQFERLEVKSNELIIHAKANVRSFS
ncbi:MAG: DUF2993 domain-containing protein [Phormidesmis sp.]